MCSSLSINPAAAAQGALAIEIATQREDLRSLLQAIQCQQTFQAVSTERNILSNFGGGCQQKIGVTLLDRSYGQLEFIRGLTDQGKILDSCQIRDLELPEEWRSHKEKIFPISSAAGKWFSRVSLLPNELDEMALQKIKGKESSVALWVARAEAFPQSWQNYQFKVVWTSGLKSWQQLAERGIWVHGCSESLGEQENPRIDLVLNHRICWLKLSHVEGFLSGRYDEAESGNQISQEILGTYRLVPEKKGPDLKDKTHFYWMSGSSFQQALKNHQEIILQGYHGCGPGNTYKILSQVLPKERLKIFLNYENWRDMTLIG